MSSPVVEPYGVVLVASDNLNKIYFLNLLKNNIKIRFITFNHYFVDTHTHITHTHTQHIHDMKHVVHVHTTL